MHGPTGAPIDEALSWAREHAEVVIVRYDAPEGRPSHYLAAGEDPGAFDEPLQAWPPEDLVLGRRRTPGYEYLDRADSDAQISWDVRVDVDKLSGRGLAGLAELFGARLGEEEGIEVTDWVPGPGATEVEGEVPNACVARARLELAASTVQDAERAAQRAAESVLDRILDEAQVERPRAPLGWTVEAYAYPSGSEAAAWNAPIRDDDEEDD